MEGDGGLTWYQLAAGATSLVVLAYAWIFTRVIGDQAKLERRMTEHEQLTRDKLDELPDRYVRRDDFGQFKVEILKVLERIESKLDDKADKP